MSSVACSDVVASEDAPSTMSHSTSTELTDAPSFTMSKIEDASFDVTGGEHDGKCDNINPQAIVSEESNGPSAGKELEKQRPFEHATIQRSPTLSSAGAGDSSDDEADLSDFEDQLQNDIKLRAASGNMKTAKPGSRIRNRQALSYFLLVEARIKELEEEIAILRKGFEASGSGSAAPEHSAVSRRQSSDGLDVEAEKQREGEAQKPEDGMSGGAVTKSERWCMGPGWKRLRDFVDPIKQPFGSAVPEPIVEVLIEPMAGTLPPLKKRKESRYQADAATQPASQHSDKHEIHRIRINSPFVCGAFAEVMEKSRAPNASQTHIHPLKAMLAYYPDLRKYLSELDRKLQVLNDQPKHQTSEPGHGDTELDGAESVVVDSLDEPLDEEDEHVAETVKHLRALLEFMDEHLAT